MTSPELPAELFEGTFDLTEQERKAIIGRYAVLHELGFFKEEVNIALAVQTAPGTFIARVRKRFSGTYGDTKGCSRGDLEVTMELLGVMDDVLDFELKPKNEIHQTH